MSAVLHLVAPNDTSGNPRRLYLFISSQEPIGVWDEGYEGAECLPPSLQDYGKVAPQIRITAGEYKRLKKERGIV